jgi:deoxycytidylate deaminase
MTDKWMEVAERVARLSDYPRIHIGAVIVNKRKLVSAGINRLKTAPIQARYNRFRNYSVKHDGLHAEIDAIRNGDPCDIKGATMYIFRKDLNGNMAISKPCNACIRAIADFGIREAWYTTPEGFSRLIVEKWPWN